MTQTSCVAFSIVTPYQFVLLHTASPRPTMKRGIVMMNISGAIGPIPLPTRIGDEHFVPIPHEASGSLAPGVKCKAERDAKPEHDRATDKESRRRRGKYDERVINRNDDEVWIHRHDRDIRIA